VTLNLSVLGWLAILTSIVIFCLLFFTTVLDSSWLYMGLGLLGLGHLFGAQVPVVLTRKPPPTQ
jgi:hypothetical protein